MNAVRTELAGNLKKSSHSKGLIASILLIIFLLSVRDIGGISVNKYLFLVIVAVTVCVLPIDKVMCFIAFVMPLYVGLPGNYMTMIFLARFLVDYRKFHIRATTFMLCLLAGSYAFIQAVVTNHMTISELMFFPGMILVMFMFSLNAKIDKSELVLSYATGVAALGLIMLIHTLQIYEFSVLLNSATRLGVVIIDYGKAEGMLVNVDPNFYGYFSIVAISLGAGCNNYRSKEKPTMLYIFGILASIGSCIVVSLIGLSRSFLLVLIAWLILYLLSVKNFKAILISVCVIFLVSIIVFNFIPDVWDTLGKRFNDSSMATANGRTDVILKFHKLWSNNIKSILFGTGIFDCNVHCMPLQIIYGGGIVFSALFVSYMISLISGLNYGRSKGKLWRYLQFFATFAMSLTVPSLALVNTMYPIALIGIYLKQGEQQPK